MADEEKRMEEAEKRAEKLDTMEIVDRVSRGKLALAQPILADGKEVEELTFDFAKMTGMEMVEALDCDRQANVLFKLSAKQGLHLFAKAAAKATPGIDERDILDRMAIVDAQKAVEITLVFYNAASRAGNKRLSNA